MRESMEAQRVEAQQQMQVLNQGLQTAFTELAPARQRPEGVVDVSRVGKPEIIRGETRAAVRKLWPDWAYTFRTWFCSQFKNGDAILDAEAACRSGFSGP